MLIIDRIVGELAVLERADRSNITIPLAQLPLGVREGDCLQEVDGGYQLDPDETSRRRQQNQALFQRLIKKGDSPQ